MYKVGDRFISRNKSDWKYTIKSINNHMVTFAITKPHKEEEWECGEWYIDECIAEGTLTPIGKEEIMEDGLFNI